MRTYNLASKVKSIRLIILDVDGVLTDGGMILGSDGMEIKRFSARDGVGISLALRAGLKVALITGRSSEAVDRRAKELGIVDIYQGQIDKVKPYQELLERYRLTHDNVAAMGDDIPDLSLLERVGLGVAVNDATPELKERADYVTRAPGGHGAVRETIDLILTIQGKKEKAIASLRRISGHSSSQRGDSPGDQGHRST